MINRRRIMGFPVKAPEETDLEGFVQGRIHTNGNVRDTAGYTTSRYFEVIGGHTLRFRIGNSQYIYIAQYETNKQYITEKNNNNNPENIVLNNSTAFIRIGPRTNNLDNCYVYDLTDKKWIWRGKNVKRPN